MNEQSTAKLYQKDVYLRSAAALVLCIEKRGEDVLLITDRTPFFPEGGGQFSDTGYVETAGPGTAKRFRIDYVTEENGTVLHRLAGPEKTDASPENTQTPGTAPAAEEYPFREGDAVALTIDWDNRFENMQRHAGEHILSGRIWALFGGTNRGFHMGAEYMTIDIRFEDANGNAVPGKSLTLGMALEAERAANEIIWQDLPIHVSYFATNEEAAAMPTRKPVSFAEDISIVTVGDREAPADCCACCGTHPSSTGQIGPVKVYKVEKNKDMTRVYLDAGRKAMAHIDSHLQILTDLANANSTSPEELPARLAAEEARRCAMREELNAFRRAAADAHLGEISEALERAGASGGDTAEKAADRERTLFFTFRDISSADFSKAGKKLQKKIRGAVLAAFPEEAVLLLYADGTAASIDCGALVKERAAAYGGKGGGNKEAARAVFPDTGSMERFLADLSR